METTEQRSPRLRLDPGSWVWLVFIARRWFMLGDDRVEAGEIITPNEHGFYWKKLWFRQRLDQEGVLIFNRFGPHAGQQYLRSEWIEDGWLERLTDPIEVFRCPCRRLWATVAAFQAHGCSELPPVDGHGGSPGLADPTPVQPAAVMEVALGAEGSDAEYIRLWNEGKTHGELAIHFNVQPKTAANRIGELRRRYTVAVVPHRRVPKRQRAESG